MSDDDDRFSVPFHPRAAKHFVDVLLNVAIAASDDERTWLLWGVGLIAQSMGATPEGPT